MKHQFVIELDCDGRYAAPVKQAELRDLVAGRAWTMDGIVAHSASAKALGKDVVVISRAEYDQLKAKELHLEGQGIEVRNYSERRLELRVGDVSRVEVERRFQP